MTRTRFPVVPHFARVAVLSLGALALWTHPVSGAWWLWAISYLGIGWWSSVRAQNAFGIQWPAMWSAWCLASGIRLLPDVDSAGLSEAPWVMPHAYVLCVCGLWLGLQVFRRYRKGTPVSGFGR